MPTDTCLRGYGFDVDEGQYTVVGNDGKRTDQVVDSIKLTFVDPMLGDTVFVHLTPQGRDIMVALLRGEEPPEIEGGKIQVANATALEQLRASLPEELRKGGL